MKASIAILKKIILLTLLVSSLYYARSLMINIEKLDSSLTSDMASILSIELESKMIGARSAIDEIAQGPTDEAIGITTLNCSRSLDTNQVMFIFYKENFKKFVARQDEDSTKAYFTLEGEGFYKETDGILSLQSSDNLTTEGLPLKLIKIKSFLVTALNYYGVLMHGSFCTDAQRAFSQNILSKWKN
ncbi:MAG: hypothetical protein K9K67_06430 [Bacteriovoracaceae bacterium]|nr:hypothetical protein [Bacteriovoracaceae bacterium]